MSDAAQTQSVSEDIAFLRALAVEGQKTPFRGDISLAAGLIWGSASLYTWGAMAKLVGPPGDFSWGWVWGGAAIVFALVGIPLGMYRRRRGTNKVAAAAWGGVGLACWTIVASTALAIWRTHDWMIAFIIPAMIMALYGAAWMVGAAASRQRWQIWIGVACLLAGVLIGAAAGRSEEYLIFALALYGLMGLPGLLSVIRFGARP